MDSTPSDAAAAAEKLQPVVLKSLDFIPEFERLKPLASHPCTNCYINYYRPDVTKSGYFEFVSLSNSDSVIRLYQAGTKSLVKNLDLAFSAAKSLEKNISNLESDDTFEVCNLNSTKDFSIRLVLSVFQSSINVMMKLYTTNEKGEIYPTRKSIKFSSLDDIAAMAEFIKGKK